MDEYGDLSEAARGIARRLTNCARAEVILQTALSCFDAAWRGTKEKVARSCSCEAGLNC